jgi:ubiquinone/menaquinone biosynthesis C-methylase UbiE
VDGDECRDLARDVSLLNGTLHMTTSKDLARDALAGSAIHEHWVSMYRTPEAQPFYEMAFDEIARRLGAPPDATILDAGCGSCAKSVLLAKRGFKVVGTDFSREALALAAGTVRDAGVEDRVTLRQGDLLALPFEEGAFKYVICWGVLMHVPQLEKAMAELARVLAPGGMLVLSEGNMHSAQSVALRGLKRLFGRGRGRVVRSPAGLENHEETAQGPLVTRQTDMQWMASAFKSLGLRLEARIPGQFTELYVLMPWRWQRRAIHAFNNTWFRVVGLAAPAYGNILIFRKSAA